ncbi:MAG: ABC transporter substrate-binding protein [Deltaproteobacteria bacterium]|nr:ABC transporter substrate-binding protein [Deltaproteobacteria bacterium]MBW2498361.1 ABC transporter substrate-binding protein [Deltaproteobacteria bacterium]
MKTSATIWLITLGLALAGAAATTRAEGEAAAEGAAAIEPAAASDKVAAAQPVIAAEAPVQVVETFHAGLLDIMKRAQELGQAGRVEEMGPLMGKVFDLDFMASKAIGTHWRRLSDADKARWTEVFKRFTTASYAGRFTGFKGEEFVTLGLEEAARGTRLVLTKIIVPGEDDVQLNYRLLENDGHWRVIDVYLNGTVSELALRRSEYASALKREGFEELVAAIETKIADLEAKGRADG